jgi:hypothetical protein
VSKHMAITPVFANSSNQIAALKELYKDPSEVLKDMVILRICLV